MASIADLVEDPAMKQLATEDAYARGERLAASGAVQLVAFGPVAITARIEDREDRDVYTVELLRTIGDTLAWSCSCSEGQTGAFCRHCVATGLETWRKAPKRRG